MWVCVMRLSSGQGYNSAFYYGLEWHLNRSLHCRSDQQQKKQSNKKKRKRNCRTLGKMVSLLTAVHDCTIILGMTGMGQSGQAGQAGQVTEQKTYDTLTFRIKSLVPVNCAILYVQQSSRLSFSVQYDENMAIDATHFMQNHLVVRLFQKHIYFIRNLQINTKILRNDRL